jgi:hypothetical protein
MKTKMKELDVDYIGTQDSTLTKTEKKAISDYIRLHKTKMKLKSIKSHVKV